MRESGGEKKAEIVDMQLHTNRVRRMQPGLCSGDIPRWSAAHLGVCKEVAVCVGRLGTRGGGGEADEEGGRGGKRDVSTQLA